MLAHHRAGSGPPLLLLHGIGMRWQWWTPCLPALAERFDVVAVDFPGFGGSAPLADGDEPTPVRLALAIEELCGELGIARPHVAGISMGGWVGLELARRGVLSSACAISPGGFYQGWERRWADGSLRTTVLMSRALEDRIDALVARPRMRALLLSQVLGRPGRMPPAEAGAAFRATARSDFLRTLRPLIANRFVPGEAMDVPVTIAWGSRDRLLWPRQADRALAAVPGARFVPLPGCGHIPTYDEPDLVVRTIVEATKA